MPGEPGSPTRRAAFLATRRRTTRERYDRVHAARHERYDAVICIGAREFVGPEDWPDVARRLHDAARPGAPIWLTVELFGRRDGQTAEAPVRRIPSRSRRRSGG
jgi:cyclopropane fatty-acyl-phospholipid synthase-like methyltransferase